jgi:hypothetical protein
VKIKTWHEYPPIPDRRFDYGAMDEDDNADGTLIGWGPTEAEAVLDLLRLFQERDELREERRA